jgi:hypothetical protein
MSEVFTQSSASEKSFSMLQRCICSTVDYAYRLILVIKVKVSKKSEREVLP